MEWTRAEKILTSSDGRFAPRDQQRILAQRIDQSFKTGHSLVAQAPTGTGKTFAYLIPLIGRDGRSLVATGTKVLQDQVKSDLEYLEKHLDVSFSWSILKGRSNYLCVHRANRSALRTAADRKKVEQIMRAALGIKSGDRALLPRIEDHLWAQICSESDYCSARKCSTRTVETCWAEAARAVAAASDIVSINHHLLFVDQAFKARMGTPIGFLPEYDYLVIDEAHRAADTARVCLGETLTEKDMTARLAKVEQGLEEAGIPMDNGLSELIGDVDSQILAIFRDKQSQEDNVMPTPLVTQLVAAVSSLSAAVNDSLRVMGDSNGGVAATFVKSIDYACGLLYRSIEDDRLSSWWDLTGTNPKITVAKVDVRGGLPDVPTVLLSATLFPKGLINYHPGQFGMENYDSLILPSPFDLPKQVIGYATSRDAEPAEVPLEELVGLVKASRGRALVLFTNRENMLRTTEHLRNVLPYQVYMQGDDSVDATAKKFRDDTDSVLCATRSFFEGVNFPGETCSLVVIMALPFTHPDDPLHKSRQKYLENRNIRAFSGFTLPEMLTTFEQAVGRAIRTVEDRAAIAILDPRLAAPARRKQYGHDVAKTLKGIKWTYNVSDVETFFANS